MTSGVLPPRPTPLMRALRLALTAMSEGVRTEVAHPQAFYNAGDPQRSCPTDRLSLMIDEACEALAASPLSAEARLEQALALPRTLEAHIRAKLAAPAERSLTEHKLRAVRADAAEDMLLAEALAHPNDPSINLRAADMAEHEAREKLSLATHIRAFFSRRATA